MPRTLSGQAPAARRSPAVRGRDDIGTMVRHRPRRRGRRADRRGFARTCAAARAAVARAPGGRHAPASAPERETMRPSSVAPRYRLVDASPHEDSFGAALAAGLARPPRSIPCRFLYDAVGSKLFEEICELPEYYLTRAEREILRLRAGEIAARFAGPITLAELGSGSAAKTRLLIEAFLRSHGALRYVPIDISRSMLEASSQALLARHPQLEIRAVAAELEAGLDELRRLDARPKL